MGKNLGMLGKIPGMGSLAQMNNLRKMAQGMAGGGGMPDFGAGMFPGMGAPSAPRKPVDRDKLKKLRKDAKKARKKNRNR
jgi:signal recognition particle subunit SRP54